MGIGQKPTKLGEHLGRRGRRSGAVLRRGAVLSGAVAVVAIPLPLGAISGSGATSPSGSEAAVGSAPSQATTARPVTVAIDTRKPGAPVPDEFLGLSFEMSALGQLAGDGAHGNLVTLLRSLGPGVLRFGGVSSDTQAGWTGRAIPLAAWASVPITDRYFQALAKLAARSGWHVLLTLGLAHFEPASAAREAAAAKTALGKWLAGVEVGNEPDAYAQHGLRPEPWTFTQYYPQVLAYRRAIARAAPSVPLAGPDVSGSHAFPRWGPPEASELKPALLTGHHYPLGCHKTPAPTIEGLLSPETRYKEQQSLNRYMTVARAHHIPFRLTEANTVSCGGTPGISDTFASALWAVDYTARAMTSGLDGVNFQGAPANCTGYTPLCATTHARLAAGALHAQPEWYALLLARKLLGDRPLKTVIERAGGADVDVRSLLSPEGALEVVIVDDDPPGRSEAKVSLRLDRRFGTAKVLALTAPSPGATFGVRLGGRAVLPNGSWSEAPRLPSAPDKGRVVTVTIAPSSALLLSVAPLAPQRQPARRP